MYDYGVDNVDKVIHSFPNRSVIKKNNQKEKQTAFPYRKKQSVFFACN